MITLLKSFNFLTLFLTTLFLLYFIQIASGINPYQQQDQSQQLESGDGDNYAKYLALINRLSNHHHQQQESSLNDVQEEAEEEDGDNLDKRNKFPNFHVSPLWLSRRTRTRFYGKPLWISRPGRR